MGGHQAGEISELDAQMHPKNVLLKLLGSNKLVKTKK